MVPQACFQSSKARAGYFGKETSFFVNGMRLAI